TSGCYNGGIMRVAQPIILTEQEKIQLETLSQGGPEVSLRIVLRAKTILMAHDNLTNERIAEALGATRQSISRWRKLYAQYGMEAVTKERPRSGRRPIITANLMKEIIHLRQQHNNSDGACWTQHNIAKHFQISISSVRAILRQHNKKRYQELEHA
ncbi:MAG TPA: helix-turn-helix domain-containing protein, partial [Pseudomonadales bacterium]|nr:helix-turn-helix domain-containing protein [Pseudomonadales bacterium]